MLPVYRVRDGLSSVTKNNAIFEECVRYLKRNDPILVFAEANHDLKRRIRPLSKGFTRIAFDAEVKTGWNMNLKVIPVGLSYTDHRRSRNDVTVCFGEPIPMDQFKEQYEQDNRAAVKALKEAVSEGMKKTTMHVESLNDYPLVHVVLDDLEPDPKNYLLPDVANANVKKVVEHADESLRDTASRVKEISEKFGLNIKANFAHSANILKAIVLAPLYLFSWLNNRLALIGVNWVIDNKIKDHVFDASIKFILGLTLFPLSWLIVSIPIWVLFGIKWAAIYLLTSAITVIFFKDAQAFLLRSQQRKDLQRFKENHPAEYEEFVSGIRKLNEFRNEVL